MIELEDPSCEGRFRALGEHLITLVGYCQSFAACTVLSSPLQDGRDLHVFPSLRLNQLFGLGLYAEYVHCCHTLRVHSHYGEKGA